MKNKFKNKKNSKGFTLIEVVVAMSIFVIVMSAVSGAFASAFKAYGKAREVGESLKNAQYALNLMSKTFRTSSVESPAGENQTDDEIVVFDYSQSACIKYKLSSNKKVYKLSETVTNESDCNDSTSFSDNYPIVENVEELKFFSTDSDGDASSGESTRVGKVTVMMVISNGTASSPTKVRIQSTSSLRDYSKSNIGLDLYNKIEN